jgi:hypothetical protein
MPLIENNNHIPLSGRKLNRRYGKMAEQKKIYCFINGSMSLGLIVAAVSEDGVGLCSHCSSSINFAKHDIGYNSDWKHDIYNKEYPNGWKLVWVDNPKEHEGLQNALKKNKALKNK